MPNDPSKTSRSPLTISRFQDELTRLFREVMELVGEPQQAGRWRPNVDVVETPKTVQVVAEMPGLSAEDLVVEVQAQTVILSGRKPAPAPDDESRFHRMERAHGTFERTVELTGLSGPVNTHQGRARLSEGLLIIEFPRIPEKRQRRRIEVTEENRMESP